MFSTEFIYRQPENLVDNQKCQAGFRPLCSLQQNTIIKVQKIFLNRTIFITDQEDQKGAPQHLPGISREWTLVQV